MNVNFASGETHGPNFDSLARVIAGAGGDVSPQTDGRFANRDLLQGRALVSMAAAITAMSAHKGLPLNRGFNSRPPESGVSK